EEKERISGLFFPSDTHQNSTKEERNLLPLPPPPFLLSSSQIAPPLTPPSDSEPSNTGEGTDPPLLSRKSSHGNILN
uniref:Uncharacterized protein n=1 Tax=Amphimedon queenslandica TaxID=400682 RepID=A0A1X7SY65_AMPQE